MLRFLLFVVFPLFVTSNWRRTWWDESESSSESSSKNSRSNSFESGEEESESNSGEYWKESNRLCRRCDNRYDKCIESHDICQFKLDRCKIRHNCNKGNLYPTRHPTKKPTRRKRRRKPTYNPTMMSQNTDNPTMKKTGSPSFIPTSTPTMSPSLNPSKTPTFLPTQNPSQSVSLHPSEVPSINPSKVPSINPIPMPTSLTEIPSFSPTTPTADPTSPCSSRGCGCYVYFYEQQNCIGTALNFMLQVDLSILRAFRRDFLPNIWKMERKDMSFRLVYDSLIDNSCCTLLAECDPGAYPLPWQTSETDLQQCVNFKTANLTCLVLIESDPQQCF